MLTALLAGVAGAWSPCGFSMVDTIGGALGDPRRPVMFVACATFAVGAVTGGALTFGGLAYLGYLVEHHSSGVREALGAAIALVAAVADWRGAKIAPQIRRQVPERWRHSMPLSLACGLYGILLGLGFTTFVLAFAVWALAGISFATGSPLLGLLIGCAFGVGRALPIVLMAPGLGTGDGAGALERMASEPRLWLGLRRLDALGLCLCALFLGGSVASAAGLRAATDPSVGSGELVWQQVNGPGMLRLRSGLTSILPGDNPALSPSLIAWEDRGLLTVGDRATMATQETFPVAQLSALTISDEWVVYRAPRTAGTESLFAVSVSAPMQTAQSIASGPTGTIGRPTLEGSKVVFALSTTRRSAIVEVDLATGVRHTLRFTRSGAMFANPSLRAGRLLYERTDRCSQQLRIGPPATHRHDRVLLSLPSTVRRDPGYEPGYEHHYNNASLCHDRTVRRGGAIRLGATALAASTAYVTEIPSNTARARIVTVPRARPRARARAHASANPLRVSHRHRGA